MLIFLHIPKTAGTTLRQILEKVYWPNIYFDYLEQYNFMDSNKSLMLNLRRNIKNFVRYRSKLRPTDRCIYGHFKATKYINAYPDCRLATWLREPVDRLVSHYYYWKRYPDYNHSICRQLIKEDLTLEQFARIDVMRNLMSRYFDGISIDRFGFVGTVENFDNSLKAFFDFLEIDPIHVRPVNVNANKSVNGKYGIDNSTRKLLESLNERDCEMYELALEKVLNVNLP